MENTEQTPTTPVDSPRKERREKKEKKDKKEKSERKEKKSKRDSSSSSGKEKKHKKDKKSKSTSENGTEESKPKTLEITEQKPQDDNETNTKSSESSPKEDKPSTSENTSQPSPITRSESQQTESKKDDNKTISKTPSNDNSPSVPAIVVSNESTPSPSPTENKNGNDLDNKLARSSSESKAISRSDSKSAEDDEEEEEEEEEPSKTAANAHGLVVFHTLRKPNTAIKQWESKRASLQPELLSRKTDSIQNLEKNANVSSTRKQWEGNMGQHREAIAPFAKLNDWQELEGAILSANLSSIRNKWKEIEKGKNDTLREPKPETPQPVGKLDVNQYLQAVNEKKEDSPTSPPPAQPRGNVMQFLREKRAEVHGEQPEKSKYDNLPPPPSAPISPLSGYSPTHASSAPSIAPSIAPTPKEKLALERHKSSADIKRDKEKSDKKAKADKKEKDKKEKNKSETVKVSGATKRNTVDVVFAPPISKSKTLPTQPTTLYEYNATDNRMLSIHKDQVVKILDKTISPHWILVEHDGKTGLFPATFLYIPDTNVTSTQTLGRSSTSKSSNPKGLFDVDEDEEAKAKATDRQQGGEVKIKLLAAADEEDVLKNNDPLSLQMEEDDAEHNILFKEANNNSTKEIRGASLTKIIQKLTHERTSDSELLLCFLNTFTAFTTHVELLNLLVLRYRTPKPKALDMPTFQKTKLLPIRLRVINLLKLWIKKDYIEFKEGPLHEAARDFATRFVSLSMPNPAKEILALLDEAKQGTLGQGRIVSGKPPTPHIPMNLKSDLTLMDIHPEEVARQLTLREHELFKKIKSHECIKQKWAKEAQKENAQNIIRMIHRFNRVSLWVATEIVSVEDLKLRAVLLNRFIFIAQKCLELNNFNAVMEILSALNNSAVHRLRRTWELLPPKSLEAMEDMTKLMDGEGNFAGYRETLKQAQPPILPYLGLVLTDLVFLDDGNPDIVPDTKLLNVAKWSLISGVVHREILTRGEIAYTLEPLAFIQDFIEKRPVIENQHELYELSLKREARTKKTRKPITTTKSTDK